ncbi:MAG: lipocalin family protein [Ignavibacteriaceae bacterium]
MPVFSPSNKPVSLKETIIIDEGKMLRIKIFGIFILLFASIIVSAQEKKQAPAAVSYVDLKKYSGLWYEIAKIPNSFQDQCAYSTTAEYKINEDGEIEVINKCYDEEGDPDVAEGVAQVVDKKTNAKLEVSFVSFLGIRPFWGDYWIIGLDENYNWAVVGTPNRKYGWILSRTPALPDETMKIIFSVLRKNGYNIEDFEMTIQK